ncbi:MAG: sel1 repeat family protein [Muribaculum sp.]|nr:sel1 repeat family protein [Muribaculum sp.]
MLPLRRFFLSVFLPAAAALIYAAGADDALSQLFSQAETGDPTAIYRLARLYDAGYDSIPADTLKANSLYLEAARKGLPAACNMYGFRLYNGIGMNPDRRQGLDWMEKAALDGDITAASNLGWILLDGSGVYHDDKKAAFWLSRAAEAGMPQAQSMLADLYITGRGVPADSLRAESLYNEAINSGLSDVQFKLLDIKRKEWEILEPAQAVNLGLKYYNGRAPFIGVHLFRQAAKAGDARAHALLGDAMTRARGTAYNHDKAIEEYFTAARLGNAPAQFVIGELLEIFPDALTIIGMDLSADENTAAFWLEKAAGAGVTDAQKATAALLQ